jgi:pyruvate kinase
MQVCAAKGRSVAVLMDLQGPEIRTSYIIDRETKKRVDKLELKKGDVLDLYGTDDLSEVRVQSSSSAILLFCLGCHLTSGKGENAAGAF